MLSAKKSGSRAVQTNEWGIPLMETDLQTFQDALRVSSHGKVVVITADSHKHLSKPFLRIQENYEGRKYKGTYVSMAQFKKWYKARRQDSSFTYYDDWLGFNFPGSAVLEFMHLYRGKENDAEKALMSKLDMKQVSQQYIIGTLAGDVGTLLHEMAHALFYLDASYKSEILAYLNKMDHLDQYIDLKSIFGKSDYHSSVWLDEMQAYLIAGIGDLEVHGKPVTDIQKFDEMVRNLKHIFDTHVTKYPEIVALI
jgi:hypothetical protein